MTIERIEAIRKKWNSFSGTDGLDIHFLLDELAEWKEKHTIVVEAYNKACEENERLRDALNTVVTRCRNSFELRGSFNDFHEDKCTLVGFSKTNKYPQPYCLRCGNTPISYLSLYCGKCQKEATRD